MSEIADKKIDMLLDCLYSNNKDFSKYWDNAQKLTDKYFGIKRILFNPIYLSDICLADCPYCGFRVSNKGVSRKTLKPQETIEEARFLINRGVKNILLLAGDFKHSKYVEMLRQNIISLKRMEDINWLGIEVATLETDEYKILLDAGANSVTVFQETYNRNRYDMLHTVTEYKGDYYNRYNAQEKAIKAGFKEVGFGVLYGVGFWQEDTIAMAEHALQIQDKYPNIHLRFSFPRLQLSNGQDESCQIEKVTKQQLQRAITSIRLLFPSASLVLTGRETVDFLVENASVVNVLGYNGSTMVGGYANNTEGVSQFQLNNRSVFNTFKNKLELHYTLL